MENQSLRIEPSSALIVDFNDDSNGNNLSNNGMEEKRKQIFERLQQREEERKSKLSGNSQKENPSLFWKNFNEMLNDTNITPSTLQDYLNQHVHYLPNYDVRQASEKIKKVQEENKKEKKKFSFKKKTISSIVQQKEEELKEEKKEIIKIESNKTIIDLNLNENKYILIKPTKEKETFSICNGNEQIIELKEISGAIYISNLNNCKVYLGPTNGSIFLSDCKDCEFQLASWQLRIHNSTSCKFYVNVKNNPIIENCKELLFGKYSYHYDGVNEHLQQCEISEEKNKWNQVNDFHWLKANEPSPNFRYIDSE
ncbi:hypothetical protein ABK040_001860 [Willaertia magna]